MALYQGYAPLPGGDNTDSAVFPTKLEDVDAYYALLKSRQVPLLGEP